MYKILHANFAFFAVFVFKIKIEFDYFNFFFDFEVVSKNFNLFSEIFMFCKSALIY